MRLNTEHTSISCDVDSSPKRSDESAVQATLGGDRDAFNGLVEKYEARLLRSVTLRTGCPATAEDVVQDAFMNAYTFLESFRGGSQFYTWLYRIAINAHHSETRRRSEKTTLIGSSDFPEVDDATADHSPVTHAENEELRRVVLASIGRLPEPKRRILYLREIQGLDYRSIAQKMELQVGTVRSRLSRAREALREELSQYMELSSEQNEPSNRSDHHGTTAS